MNPHYKPLSNPILILSDAPEQPTGLARVGRDIASLLCTLPQFRVGYLGRGGVGRRKFPWTQYSYPESGQWGEDYIAEVWQDFSCGEPGVIWSNWDATRLLWFAHPTGLPEPLMKFLGPDRTYQKWGYFPIDSVGPSDAMLPTGARYAINGFDRVMASSQWGYGLIGWHKDADWMPHGINMSEFTPAGSRERAKHSVGWGMNSIMVGCVMSNQARKDWPVAFETAALLRREYGNQIRFWFHTDRSIHYWNIPALAVDYGINDSIELTIDLEDAALACRYSACDATYLPSGGEGFGFPIAESMACGTPCVVTDYAAGQEIVEEDCRVEAIAWRIDTAHNVRRAVLSGYGFKAKIQEQIEKKRGSWDVTTEEMRARVEHLDWNSLRHQWTRWFLKGIGQ